MPRYFSVSLLSKRKVMVMLSPTVTYGSSLQSREKFRPGASYAFSQEAEIIPSASASKAACRSSLSAKI